MKKILKSLNQKTRFSFEKLGVHKKGERSCTPQNQKCDRKCIGILGYERRKSCTPRYQTYLVIDFFNLGVHKNDQKSWTPKTKKVTEKVLKTVSAWKCTKSYTSRTAKNAR